MKSIYVLKDLDGLAHELFAVSQLMPGEGIVDAVDRIKNVIIEESDCELSKVKEELSKVKEECQHDYYYDFAILQN